MLIIDAYLVQLKFTLLACIFLAVAFEGVPLLLGFYTKIKDNFTDFIKYQVGIGIYAGSILTTFAICIYVYKLNFGFFDITNFSIPLQVVVLLVSSEFFIYFFHFAAHKYRTPVLSKAHRFHHRITTDMDWVNGRKEHIFVITLFMFVFATMFFVVFKSSSQAHVTMTILYVFLNAFSHYRVPMTVKVFDKIFLFPKDHFRHHTERGGPYGVALSIFDTIFGTR